MKEGHMSDQEDIAYNVLQLLGVALLQRTGAMQYVVCGKVPQFYEVLFPSTAEGPCAAPWKFSPMLEFFMEDVERFFELKKTGILTSGVWQENGKTETDTAMIAAATTFGAKQVLTVRLLRAEFKERQDVREQSLQHRQLSQNLKYYQKKATLDTLTKVFNKETFSALLLDEIKRSHALEYPLSLLILDIDDFKKVNDTYGHLAGDNVLSSLAECVKKTLRSGDIVARFGGEEFVVLLPHSNAKQAHNIGEKIRRNITLIRADVHHPITVSMGCATYIPGEVSENFLARADTGLYEAKASGKNRVCTR